MTRRLEDHLRWYYGLACALLLMLCAVPARALTFGVFGDTPYFAFEEPGVRQMIEQMNTEPLAFVAHVGDFKSGGSECSDGVFADRLALFQRSKHPFVFIPGDNEWTDCSRASAGRYVPIERLDALRRLFHATDRSLGQNPIALERQSSDPKFAPYRENMRWSIDGVLFVAFNVPGSSNNSNQPQEMDARMAANSAWLTAAIARARATNARALVMLFHADPQFDRWANENTTRDGFVAWRRMLRGAATAFKRPILLIHGDGHRYRIDQPLRDPANGSSYRNVTRLEVFGTPELNWVRVTVSDESPATFRIEPGRPRFAP